MPRRLLKIPGFLRRRFVYWLHNPPTFQNQLLALAVSLLLVTVISSYGVYRILSYSGELRDAQIAQCERGNPLRHAIRDNANALARLLRALSIPPSLEERALYESFKAYALAHPDPVNDFLMFELRARFEAPQPSTNKAFGQALKDLALVNKRAHRVANCPDIVSGSVSLN